MIRGAIDFYDYRYFAPNISSQLPQKHFRQQKEMQLTIGLF